MTSPAVRTDGLTVTHLPERRGGRSNLGELRLDGA